MTAAADVSKVIDGVWLRGLGVDCADPGGLWPLRDREVGSSGASFSELLDEFVDAPVVLGDNGRFRKGLLGEEGANRVSEVDMGSTGRKVRGK